MDTYYKRKTSIKVSRRAPALKSTVPLRDASSPQVDTVVPNPQPQRDIPFPVQPQPQRDVPFPVQPQPQRDVPRPSTATTRTTGPTNLPKARPRVIPHRVGAISQLIAKDSMCTFCNYPLCNMDPVTAWTFLLAFIIVGMFIVLLFYLPAYAQWITGIIGFLLGVLFPSPLQANRMNRSPTTPDQQAEIIANLQRANDIETGTVRTTTTTQPTSSQPTVLPMSAL